MHTLAQEFRHTLRGLRKTPGFTLVAVLVLALGIGVNTAIFSLIDTLLFKPGVGHPAGLVGLFTHDPKRPDSYRPFSYPDYVAIRSQPGLFEHLMARTFAMVGLTEGDTTRRVFAGVVSSNYFETLGVTLASGRTFTAAEERPGADIPVVIVSDAYWRAHGSNPHLIGQAIRVNGRPYTVVGIAPPGFVGTLAVAGSDLWFPLGVYSQVVNDILRSGEGGGLADPRTHALIPAGRLVPGLTPAAVNAKLQALAAGLAQQDPTNDRGYQLSVAPLQRMSISTVPQGNGPLTALSALLMAMAGIVLLIACLNLANMVLARGAARRRDVAVRLALGAGRGRVIRHLLIEGLTLAVLGSAAGLLLATWAMHLLVVSLGAHLPVALSFSPAPDGRVLAAALAFAVISTLLFSLGPAWKLSRTDVLTDLKSGGDARASESVGRLSGRNLMVVGQVALALALLVAGGLFVRGAVFAASANPGFHLDHELLASVDPSMAGDTHAQGHAVYERVLARLRALPGVENVSLASTVPFGDIEEDRRVTTPGQPVTGTSGKGPAGINADYVVIGADYFRTLGLPLLRGREFDRAEEQGKTGQPVAVIDEPLAHRLFGSRDPLGRRITLVAGSDGTPAATLQVIGIVPGLRQDLFDRAPDPHVYVPFGSHYQSGMYLHLRVSAGGAAMLPVVRRAIHDVAPQLPILSLRTMRQYRDGNLELWLVRTGARIFTLFGVLALLLAGVGVYGVKAYVVSRRTREIGIRMALGAEPRDVLWLVMREGLVLTGVGLAVGLVLAAGLARLLSSLLYQVGTFDPLVFLAAPVILGLAAMVATYVPARRATKVVPLEALRFE